MKKKEKLIEKIRTIIKEWGSFDTSDVQATSSPVYNTMGKDSSALIERFNLDDVDIVMYVHETETGEDSVEYDKLDTDTLEEILELAKEYKEIMKNTMDKCKNENF